ncbi:MAG: hypothetical protein LBS08_05610 [Candidatus Symbiothrix sp.]|jgi:hypothetical protein|nr:hypothetical protein [Candidatus Symbiothrix sp.]
MSSEELRTKICHLVLTIKNESVLKETLSFLEDSFEDEFDEFAEFDDEIIPGLPRTYEERMAAVDQGMADYRNGRVCTTEELFIKHPEWKLDGQKEPIGL